MTHWSLTTSRSDVCSCGISGWYSPQVHYHLELHDSRSGVCELSANSYSSCCLFSYGPWAKNDLCILRGWKKIQRRVFCVMWKLHEIYTLVPINEVLWGHSYTQFFIGCLWLLLPSIMELNGHNRDGLRKAEHMCSGPFPEKVCLSTPGSKKKRA